MRSDALSLNVSNFVQQQNLHQRGQHSLSLVNRLSGRYSVDARVASDEVWLEEEESTPLRRRHGCALFASAVLMTALCSGLLDLLRMSRWSRPIVPTQSRL